MPINYTKLLDLAVQGENAWDTLVNGLRRLKEGKVEDLSLTTTQKGEVRARLKAALDTIVQVEADIKTELGG